MSRKVIVAGAGIAGLATARLWADPGSTAASSSDDLTRRRAGWGSTCPAMPSRHCGGSER